MSWFVKRARRFVSLGVLAGLLGSVAQPAASADLIYWTDFGIDQIRRANLDGSGVEDLVASFQAVGIALDVAGGKMYWTDNGFTPPRIRRANLDGSGVEDLVTTGLMSLAQIALDVAGGKMYWADSRAGAIQRATLDGSGVVDLITGLVLPEGIALDVAGGKMYFTETLGRTIQGANLDGSSAEALITTGLDLPVFIALDVAGGKMYWTDAGTLKVQRANLDGSGVEDLVTAGVSLPIGIALDVAGGKMYWTDRGLGTGIGKVQRANLDGSDVEDLVTTPSGQPLGVALALAQANNPPVANAGADQVVECGGPDLTSVTLDASGSSDPDGDPLTYTWMEGTTTLATTTDPVKIATCDLGLGQHAITLTVDDGNGGTSTDQVSVTVQDTTVPSIGTVTASPGVLGPPNHKLVPVVVTVSVWDVCDTAPTCRIVSVSSNEPVSGLGGGDTAPDWVITGSLTVNLRAERSGQGSGRVYTILVQCTDASGNSATRSVSVTVPH